MARGKQFSQLIADLKDELGHSSSVAVGVDLLATLQYDINRSYESLWDDYDWPHLRIIADRIPLSAGERYYDFPTQITLETLTTVEVWYNNQALGVERGVGTKQYNIMDPALDARSDPVLNWDVVWNEAGKKAQIEVWPMPVSNDQELQLIGKRPFAKLVDDSDVCYLDSIAVVLFAAARRLKRQKSTDGDVILAEAQQRLATIRGRVGPTSRVIMGGGVIDPVMSKRIQVIIAGS